MKSAIISTNYKAIKLVSKNEKWLIPSIIINSLFANLSPYVNIYMSALIVNEISGQRNVRDLTILVLITVLSNLVISLVSSMLGKFKNRSWTRFENAEKIMFMEHGFSLDYVHLEDSEVRQSRRKIDESKNINNYGIWSMIYSFENISDSIINIIFAIIFMSSLFGIIITQSNDIVGIFLFPILLILLVSLSIFISMKNSKKLSKLGEEMSDNMIYVNKISNSYGGYQMGKDIRIYDMIKIYKRLNDEVEQAHIKGSRKYWFGHRNTLIPDAIISQVINFLTYAFVCLNAVRGLFQVGSVILYVGYISRLIDAFKSFSSNIAMYKMNLPFLQHYLKFFDIENTMTKGRMHIDARGSGNYEIEFHNVSFKYPGSETFAIENLSMILNNNKRLAVVGMNGSGKTTMIKLLCRLYDPCDGKITLNGVDIKEYDYLEYMGLFSVVFQDFKLFSVDLGQNVAADSVYDENKVNKCLNEAGFSKRLADMPNGLKTCLYKDFEESGEEISGGEAQKIALARALYKEAPFIILDEPTAALDPISEEEIYMKFNEIINDKTAVYISHRLSSCRFCDEIAVFHEGKLIQHGSHQELVSMKQGKYYEMWAAQAQYYT